MPVDSDTLRAVPWISALQTKTQLALTHDARTLTLHRGESVGRDSLGDKFVYVASGAVKVVHDDTNGRDTIMLIAISRQLVYGCATWLGAPIRRRLDAMQDDSRLLLLHGPHVASVARKSATVACGLMTALASGCNLLDQRAADLSVTPLPRRMALVVLDLARRFGRPAAEGIVISLALSRQDLADLSGTTIETAIRVVRRFQAAGFVRTARRRLVVTDVPGLEAVADGALTIRAR